MESTALFHEIVEPINVEVSRMVWRVSEPPDRVEEEMAPTRRVEMPAVEISIVLPCTVE